jgi:hypothetical protein
MKQCKCCRSLLIGKDASAPLQNLEKLLKRQGFMPNTIHDVAASLGPMCEKCLKAWEKDLCSN